MNVIDSHMHVNLNGLSLDDIIHYLDKERIDCCWLLTWEEISPGLWAYENLSIELVYEAYLKYPSRIVPFYAPDPHRDDAVPLLQKWYEKGIRGCGELKATVTWESDYVKTLLNQLRKLRIPLVFHMEESELRHLPRSHSIQDRILYHAVQNDHKVCRIPSRILRLMVKNWPSVDPVKSYMFPGYMLDFTLLESALQDFSDVKFVAHGLMFWKHISSDAINCKKALPAGPVIGEGTIWRLLREYKNLYADISADSGLNALIRDPENAKRFLSEFENKILYGTDNVLKGQKEFLVPFICQKGLIKEYMVKMPYN